MRTKAKNEFMIVFFLIYLGIMAISYLTLLLTHLSEYPFIPGATSIESLEIMEHLINPSIYNISDPIMVGMLLIWLIFSHSYVRTITKDDKRVNLSLMLHSGANQGKSKKKNAKNAKFKTLTKSTMKFILMYIFLSLILIGTVLSIYIYWQFISIGNPYTNIWINYAIIQPVPKLIIQVIISVLTFTLWIFIKNQIFKPLCRTLDDAKHQDNYKKVNWVIYGKFFFILSQIVYILPPFLYYFMSHYPVNLISVNYYPQLMRILCIMYLSLISLSFTLEIAGIIILHKIQVKYGGKITQIPIEHSMYLKKDDGAVI